MGWASMKSLSGPAHGLEPTAQQLRPLIHGLGRLFWLAHESPGPSTTGDDWLVMISRGRCHRVLKMLERKLFMSVSWGARSGCCWSRRVSI